MDPVEAADCDQRSGNDDDDNAYLVYLLNLFFTKYGSFQNSRL